MSGLFVLFISLAIRSVRYCYALLFVFFLETKNETNNEELILNTIATVNNLSFYNTKQSAVVKKQLHIAQCRYLFHVVHQCSSCSSCSMHVVHITLLTFLRSYSKFFCSTALKTSMLTILFLAGLLKFLEVDNIEGLAESTRVYGNLSRDKSVRDFLVKQKGAYIGHWS